MKALGNETRGVTLLELMVVIAIIGVLVMIGIPNFYYIMMGHRIRSSANDLLTKTRWVRSVSIAKRRQLDMTINKSDLTLTVEKPKHTEYDLLKDIAKAISTSSSAFPNLSSFVLYEEDAQTLETYKIGDAPKNGFDTLDTTCPGDKISFNPSGTLSTTCNITIANSKTGGQFTLKLFKGGQMVLH